MSQLIRRLYSNRPSGLVTFGEEITNAIGFKRLAYNALCYTVPAPKTSRGDCRQRSTRANREITAVRQS
jgi:hypothetical protein